ncbi:hypothetical protein [Citricoccus sp.]|uniref:hypothetical protein n=1 Tax=Citricoccus sp. TaxID=1978372 RepID=UPI00261ACF16|nr:hypothetical protein [Citricoccus sp.]HRO31289.1 hypothetical protein [Citricoccus sp.]
MTTTTTTITDETTVTACKPWCTAAGRPDNRCATDCCGSEVEYVELCRHHDRGDWGTAKAEATVELIHDHDEEVTTIDLVVPELNTTLSLAEARQMHEHLGKLLALAKAA